MTEQGEALVDIGLATGENRSCRQFAKDGYQQPIVGNFRRWC